MVNTSIFKRSQIITSLNYAFYALLISATFCIVENNFGFKVMSVLPTFQKIGFDSKNNYSLFPHQILLGSALAIGFVISIYFLLDTENTRKPYLNWFYIFLFGSSLYFSFSRGAWLSGIIGLLVIFIWGGYKSKKKMILILMIPLIVFQFKPGVYLTVQDYFDKTIQTDTLEGSSFVYRFELWDIALKEVQIEPLRTFFGYGQNYHLNTTFYGEYNRLPGKTSYFQSWDNQFAIFLLESGFLGLIVYMIFLGYILLLIAKNYYKSSLSDRPILSVFIASTIMVAFMMTNVAMFSSQLLFLFYSLASFGINFGKYETTI